MECAIVTSGIRKAKKKHEVDRVKQAEKKKRRLEKALATSAAIRSELEKKKQKKKEEQERLDEEGAAIAEAVALHVLLDEDSDDSSKVMLNKNEGLTSWDFANNIENRGIRLRVPYHNLSEYSLENIGQVCDEHRYGSLWSHWGNFSLMVSSDPPLGKGIYRQYLGDEGWGSFDLSAGCLAAQAVSSLKIADEAYFDAYSFNHMLRG